jgi:hypothetical protein
MDAYVDGVLLEAVTSAYSVKEPLRRRLLSCQLIGRKLMGSSDWQIQNGNFSKVFVLEHVSNREGKTEDTHAILLILAEEEAGLNLFCLAEATMFKSGMYNNVLVPSHFVCCSKQEQSLWRQTGHERVLEV